MTLVVARVEADASGFTRGLSEAEGALDRFGRRAAGAGAGASGMAADAQRAAATARELQLEANGAGRAMELAGRGAGMLQGALAALGLVGFVRAVVETSAEFQKLNAMLKTATGSTTEAAAAFAMLKKFAAETPYDLAQVTTAFIRLKNLGLDSSADSLRAYGNVASSFGKGLIDMIEAVADATVGENERLKEFGIRASVEGDKVKFTFQGIETAVANNARAIEQYLIGIGKVKFAGAMEEQAQQLGGALSNLGDTLVGFRDQVGQGGLAAAVNDLARALSSAAAGSDNAARRIGAALGEGVRLGIVAVENLDVAVEALVTTLGAVAATRVLGGIASLVTAIRAAGGAMAALNAVAAANPFVLMGTAAAAAGLAVYGWYQRSVEAERAQAGLASASEDVRSISNLSAAQIANQSELLRANTLEAITNAEAKLALADAEAQTAAIRARANLDTQRAMFPGVVTPGVAEAAQRVAEMDAAAAAARASLVEAQEALAKFTAGVAAAGTTTAATVPVTQKAKDALDTLIASYDETAARALKVKKAEETIAAAIGAGGITRERGNQILADYKKYLDEEAASKNKGAKAAGTLTQQIERQLEQMKAETEALALDERARFQAAEVQKALNAAKERGIALHPAVIETIRDEAGALYDQEKAAKAAADARERIGRLVEETRTPLEAYRAKLAELEKLKPFARTPEELEAIARAARAADPAVAELKRQWEEYAREVERVVDDISTDVATLMFERLTDPDKAGDVLDFFRDLFKRIAVEALKTQIVQPIVAQVVGSVPQLFGLSTPANQNAQPVSVGGQTYVPANQNAQSGGTGGLSLTSLSRLTDPANLPSWWNNPIFGGGGQSVVTVSPSVLADQNAMLRAANPGLNVTADPTVATGASPGVSAAAGVTWGQVATAAGSALSAFNAFKSFSQGQIGSGIGSTISAGLGIAQLAGVALGPLGPIAMIAAPIIGGLLDGLFAGKPSNMEGTATRNWETGGEVIGGQTGKKYSAENRGEASRVAGAVYDMGERLEKLLGGTLTGEIVVAAGSRDGYRVQDGWPGPVTEKYFPRTEAGLRELTGWFAGRFVDRMKGSLSDQVQRAIPNIDWSDLEEGLKQLQRAMDFDATATDLAGGYALENAARKQAKEAMRQTTEAWQEWLDTTEKLWPGTTTGGTTRTETVREQVTLSAAEAIAQGLLARSQNYLGDATWETVWKDLDGTIVQVGEDLRDTVSVWKEVSKTVTEGGTAVDSAETARAKAAIRTRVDSMIAGTPERTYTAGEAAAEAAKARWDPATVKPLLEMAGYAGEELARKAAEGLANEMAGLRRAADAGLYQRGLAQGGIDLSGPAAAAAQYATDLRDLSAQFAAGAERTGRLNTAIALMNRGLLASAGVAQAPVSALSGSVSDFVATLGLTGAAVAPVTAALDAVQRAASTGVDAQGAYQRALSDLIDAHHRGTLDADDFAASVARITVQLREAVAVDAAIRGGRNAVAVAVNPAWRASAADLAAQLGLTATAAATLTPVLERLDQGAAAGSLRLSDVTDALATADTALRGAVISGEQYAGMVQTITTAWAQSQAVLLARAGGLGAVERAIDPTWRGNLDYELTTAGLGGAPLVALRDTFTPILTAIGRGGASAAQMRAALADLDAELTGGRITIDQYNAGVAWLTQAWQDGRQAAEAAASALSQSWSGLVQQATSELTASQNEIANAARQAASGWDAVARNLRAANQNLLTDATLSNLRPEALRDEARRQFEDLAATIATFAAKAQAGTATDADRTAAEEAAGRLQEAGRKWLEAQNALSGDRTAYDAAFRAVTAGQEATAGLSLTIKSAEERRAEAAEAQIDWLQRIAGGGQTQSALLAEIKARLQQGDPGLASLPELIRRMPGYVAYSAPADVAAGWSGLSDAGRSSVARAIGYTGDVNNASALNDHLVSSGRQAEYERLTRGLATASATPYSSSPTAWAAWQSLSSSQLTAIARDMGWQGDINDAAYNRWIVTTGQGDRLNAALIAAAAAVPNQSGVEWLRGYWADYQGSLGLPEPYRSQRWAAMEADKARVLAGLPLGAYRPLYDYAATLPDTDIELNVRDVARSRGIPGFERGGDHAGGLRIVGERTWEVEATGPARYMTPAQLLGAAVPQPIVRVDMQPTVTAIGGVTAAVLRVGELIAGLYDRMDAVEAAVQGLAAEQRVANQRVAKLAAGGRS